MRLGLRNQVTWGSPRRQYKSFLAVLDFINHPENPLIVGHGPLTLGTPVTTRYHMDSTGVLTARDNTDFSPAYTDAGATLLGVPREPARTSQYPLSFIDSNVDWSAATNGAYLRYSGGSRWALYVNTGGGASTVNAISSSVSNELAALGIKSVEVTVSGGSSVSDVQFHSGINPLTLVAGKTYTCGFWVWSDAVQEIYISFGQLSVSPFTNLIPVTIKNTSGAGWEFIEISGVSTADTALGRVWFSLGNVVGTIRIIPANHEQGEVTTSWIPTTTSFVTRASELTGDYTGVPLAGNFVHSQGTVTMSISPGFDQTTMTPSPLFGVNGTSRSVLGMASDGSIEAYDGTNTAAGPAGSYTQYQKIIVACEWGGGKMRVGHDVSGTFTWGTEVDFAGSWPVDGSGLARIVAGSFPGSMYLQKLAVWNRKGLTAGQITGVVT